MAGACVQQSAGACKPLLPYRPHLAAPADEARIVADRRVLALPQQGVQLLCPPLRCVRCNGDDARERALLAGRTVALVDDLLDEVFALVAYVR